MSVPLAARAAPALQAPSPAPPPARERRERAPTVLQMEAVECGAAALAMVLGFHGRFVPLEELRVACGVSRDGSKASNMVRAARRYGLAAHGFKKEPAELRDVPLPAILHWNFNHFVVLEGFRGGWAHINDPATGPRRVSAAEVDQAFTGVVLTFQRAAEFREGGALPSLYSSLQRRLVGSRRALAFVVLVGVALVVPGFIIPAFPRVFVDDVLVKGLHGWARPLLLAAAAAAALVGALTWLQHLYLLRLETRLSLSTSGRFFWHVLRLPIPFFTQRFAGEVGSRVAINDRVAQLLSGELAAALLGVLVIALYVGVMVQYDLLLTAMGVAVALLNVLALRWAARRRTDLSRRLQQDRGKLMGMAMGGLQTIETLKATGSENDFFSRWAGQQAKVFNAQQDLALSTHLLAVLPPFLMGLNSALLLGVGGLRVMDGEMSMGMLVAFQALLLTFLAPVNRLVGLGGTLQEIRGDLTRLDDVLDAPAGVPEVPPGEVSEGVPHRLTGRLEVRKLTFGYSPLEPPLIEDFSLVVEPGRRVALVGGSGSGKSTLARLVCGLAEPWSGEILLDGVPRGEIPRETLRASLAFVDQEIFLFQGTVRDNLTLWDPTVPEADVVHAARDAAIHDDVTARTGGYHGAVEEGGRNFSGGQRQRLEIARALVGKPPLLVLDEATSALDAATEKEIDDHLRRRGCACLLVAHRLSTIRDCDEIIVLERGRVVQRGTHDELFAVDGTYRRLIEAE